MKWYFKKFLIKKRMLKMAMAEALDKQVGPEVD